MTGQRPATTVADRQLPSWPIEVVSEATIQQRLNEILPAQEDVALDQSTARLIEQLLATQLAHLSHSLAKAREVQRGFMPHNPPPVAGLEITAELRPAGEVGGDFYDFIINRRDELIFSVGDVSSKGVSAALLTPVICKLLRVGLRFLENVTPQALLTYIHDDLYAELSNIVMFTTMFVGHYSPPTRTIVYANAGHAPVIYRPVNGRAVLLQADGPPVGLLDHNSWRNSTLTFNPGDLLLVGTDGLIEAKGTQGTIFGYERLLEFVDRLADQPTPVIAAELFTILQRFAPNRQHVDDQTLVLFKGTPQS